MTTHTCDTCGDPVTAKNATGHYRSKCAECIQAVADERVPHAEQCETADCPICMVP